MFCLKWLSSYPFRHSNFSEEGQLNRQVVPSWMVAKLGIEHMMIRLHSERVTHKAARFRNQCCEHSRPLRDNR